MLEEQIQCLHTFTHQHSPQCTAMNRSQQTNVFRCIAWTSSNLFSSNSINFCNTSSYAAPICTERWLVPKVVAHRSPLYSLPICAMSRFYRVEHTLPLKVTTFRFRSLYFELPSFSCHRLSVSCAVAILSPILASNSYFSHAAAFSIHCTFCRQ